MTWLKLSDNFGDECARAGLSDAAFRTHVEALLWIMAREARPELDSRAFRRFAETADPAVAIRELVKAGFWEVLPGGRLRVVHHMEYQPEPDVLAERRKTAAVRQRKYRRKQAGLIDDAEPRNGVTDGVTRRVPRALGAERSGTGRAPKGERVETEPWPPVPGGSDHGSHD